MKKQLSKKKVEEKGSFFKLSHIVLSSPEFKTLPHSAQILFVHLCRLRNHLCKGANYNVDMAFWRFEKDLLNDSGLKRSTFHYARRRLIQKNFIHFTRNSPPKYKICDDVYLKQENKLADKHALKHKHDDLLPLENSFEKKGPETQLSKI